MKRFIQKRSAWSLKIAALVASTLLASVLPTLVQTAQASTPTNGTTEVINIEAGQTVQRSFNATQGNLIVYGLGNTVDANDYLQYRIYDSTGKGVGDCKYTCPLYQHKIVARSFFPPSTGTYFMVLNFNNPKTTGAVKVSILDAIQNPPQVLSGMTVENFQSSDVAKIFRITATQGNLIVYGLGNTVDANDYLQYRIYDSTGQAVGDCKYTCILYQNKTVARSFSPPSTGTYFMVLNFNNPKTTGAVKLSFPESSEPSNVPSPSASALTPTPKATSASPSSTPTKTSTALSKVPAGVTLDVTTTDSDVHTGAVTTVTYIGDIYDPTSKPSRFDFYQKSATSGVQELVASVALSDAKCIKKSTTKYSCTFPTFKPYSATTPAANVPLTVSATNAIGTGPVSNPVGLYAYMVQPIGDNWKLTKWDEVSKAIFGTGLKNWLGFRSREGNSPIEATFIFKGTWPKNPKYNVKFVEKRANGTDGNIITANYSELLVERIGQNHVVTVPSKVAVIRGDSVYIAAIEVKDGTGVAVRGRHSVSFSLDYKMSLGCSSSVLARQLIRDGGKANLMTISWALTTTVLIFNETLKRSGGTKEERGLLKKRLAVLTGLAELADAGVELIDAEAALSSGDKTVIIATVKGIAETHLKSFTVKTFDEKTQTSVLSWELDRKAALDLLGFLQTQGNKNGEFISDNCS